MRVIKLGGNELDRPGFLADLAASLRALPEAIVIVHGGGVTVDALQQRMGVKPVKVEGMRVTDDESLQAVVMALCGTINKQIVAEFVGHGIDAVGLCGVDGGLLRVRKLEGVADLGWVGEITEVRTKVLDLLMGEGMTPVVAPVSIGPGNHLFNVNADQAAAAIAAALRAEALEFVSNVDGVTVDGRHVSALDEAQAARLIANGKINGGMIPKVNAAIQALAGGVPKVRIVNLDGLSHATAGTTLHLDSTHSHSISSPSESQNEA